MRIIHGNSNSSSLVLPQRFVPKFPLKGLSILCRFSRSSVGLNVCANERANPRFNEVRSNRLRPLALQPGQEAAAILYKKMNKKAGKRPDQTPRSFRCRVSDLFRAFSRNTASAVGSAWAFIIAITVIIVWGAPGPVFFFSDTWQLIINTGTTIVTFLMVFL